MKFFNKIKYITLALVTIMLVCLTTNTALAEETELYVGGIPAGFTLQAKGAFIIGLSDIITDEYVESPSKNADIRVGDVITKIGGKEIDGAKSIAEALADSNGEPIEVILYRNGEEIKKFIAPKKDKSGVYKLGVLVRDDLNGIGTITYFKENGEFAALGHPVLNENGGKTDISGGEVYLCSIIGVIKGEKGRAGELKGVFIDDNKIGRVSANKDSGLYGVTEGEYDFKQLKKMQTGEAVMGGATILTCIDGVEPKEYNIDIVKVDKGNRENKNLVISVTDKELLSKTSGILQGMSGSPIIQSGKIVGAVTHVFINDPSRGYGISIYNMI